MTKLVDGAVDSVDFIAASGKLSAHLHLSVCLFLSLSLSLSLSEEQLKQDMEEARATIKAGDNPQVSSSTSAVASYYVFSLL